VRNFLEDFFFHPLHRQDFPQLVIWTGRGVNCQWLELEVTWLSWVASLGWQQLLEGFCSPPTHSSLFLGLLRSVVDRAGSPVLGFLCYVVHETVIH